jgi:outer membrane protein, multidrug efflux system
MNHRPFYLSAFPYRLQSSALLLLVLGLTGCVAGRDYHEPDLKLDARFHETPANVSSEEEASLSTFWTGFNDPLLNQLIETALKNNTDIRVAIAHLQAARAQLEGVNAEFWPVIGTHASVKHSVMPQTQAPGNRDARTYTAYETAVDMSWEANLFGRFSRAKEASQALSSAEEAGLQAVQVSLSAEIATLYFTLRGLQAQRLITADTVSNLKAVLNVAQTREKWGRSSALEVAQVNALLEGTQATLPDIEASIQRTQYRLSRLTGQQPTQLNTLLTPLKPLPALAPIKSIGTPSSLLHRRPDIRQAERKLAAATATIGFNTADLFPSVSFSGLLGLNAGHLNILGNGESFLYNLGASIAWTAIDFGRIRSRIKASEADADAALALYEGTVLRALEETESALTTFTHTAEQSEHLFKAAQASKEASNMARKRFELGATDILTVLDVERQRLSDEAKLNQGQTAMATALVSIYKALGGGWKAE